MTTYIEALRNIAIDGLQAEVVRLNAEAVETGALVADLQTGLVAALADVTRLTTLWRDANALAITRRYSIERVWDLVTNSEAADQNTIAVASIRAAIAGKP